MSLTTSYYTSLPLDSERDLRERIRNLQKAAARVEANLIKTDCAKVKKTFKADGKAVVSNTKTAIQSIYGQVDSSIKGTAADALKETVAATLPKYDNIFS